MAVTEVVAEPVPLEQDEVGAGTGDAENHHPRRHVQQDIRVEPAPPRQPGTQSMIAATIPSRMKMAYQRTSNGPNEKATGSFSVGM